MTSYRKRLDRHRQLREVAILVASLDDRWTDRLLDTLSPEQVAEIWEAVEELGSIDPNEQEEIVEKFRRSTEMSRPTRVDGVELDASLLARFEEQSFEAVANNKSCGLLDVLTEEEELCVVNALSGEHPQTIAIILSRIDPGKASKLLTKFSPATQADVMTRLVDCDLADEQTIEVVESELVQWIDQQRQQKKRMTAGFDQVKRILNNTPESQRHVILEQLKSQNPSLANRLTLTQDPSANAAKLQARFSSAPTRRELPTYNEQTRVSNVDVSVDRTSPVSECEVSEDPLRELELLDDATLFTALSQAERQVATLALAGATDNLMMRVLRGLPRKQANKLRRQLRNVGPTRLSDILTAQQQLLTTAQRLDSRAIT